MDDNCNKLRALNKVYSLPQTYGIIKPIMKSKRKSTYSIMLYLRWPLLLSVLLVFMNILLIALDPHAAAFMCIFTVLFVIFSAALYIYSRKSIYSGLINFALGFDSTESNILNNLSVPTAICSRNGSLIWSNAAFEELFTQYLTTKSIKDIFPDITHEVLDDLDEPVLIHSSYGSFRYLIEMRPTEIFTDDSVLEDNISEELEGEESDRYYAMDATDGAEDAFDSTEDQGKTFAADEPDADASVYDDAVVKRVSRLGKSSFRYRTGDEALDEQAENVIIISVTDETELVQYKKDYRDTRPCEGLIYLDNYDEALASVEETRRSLLTALVDRRISNYITALNGIVKKLEKDKFFFFMNEKDVQTMLEDRFSILEEVKTINIGNELALTLSIGVGRTGATYEENYNYARAAIDLALGRGGDQAVVKSGETVTYFGGKTLAPEKNARVKARVKAQALKELLSANDKLLVMGHSNPDADSLGASIGIWKIARSYGKKAHIVLKGTNKSLEPMYRQFVGNPDYPEDMFINGDKALGFVDHTTLLVVVDVNRPSYTEEPRLLQSAGNIVVIDHHRRGTEFINNAQLSYIEPYASSASEMISEIVQYIDDTTTLTPLEADALYGGIVIDTQNFITQTGIRTFEAAAFLKRKGASVQRIRKLFRDSFSDFKARAGALDNAEVYREHFAISVLDPDGVDTPTVACAQAANNLLDVSGIKAAIVLTEYNELIYISARSIDEVNVQVMMEKLGGGGHMAIAGAQLKNTDIDAAIALVKQTIDEMIEKGEIS